MQQQTADLKSRLDAEIKDSGAKLAAMEAKCNTMQQRLDAAPLTAEETTHLLERLENAKQELEKGSTTIKRVEELEEQLHELKKGSPRAGKWQELQGQCEKLEQESKALQSSP
jgi:predicted RNase H-like nuclease (RuvC/YqgF family)